MAVIRVQKFNLLDVKRMISALWQQTKETSINLHLAIVRLQEAHASLPTQEKEAIAELVQHTVEYVQHNHFPENLQKSKR